jgi:hypothetical protein
MHTTLRIPHMYIYICTACMYADTCTAPVATVNTLHTKKNKSITIIHYI